MNRTPSCTDPEEYGRLRHADALALIMENVTAVTGFEMINSANAINRVLHEDVVSTFNVPGHTNSAVDGYAVRVEDITTDHGAGTLEVIDTVYAGSTVDLYLPPGKAIRIMTGARIPEGADTVLMQEHVEVKDRSIRISRTHTSGDNIRLAGEDIRCGDQVLQRGRLCTSADVGLIASLGIGEIRVNRRPRIAVLSTGDEIQPAGAPLKPGQIYDSNRPALIAALSALNVDIIDLGIRGDNEAEIFDALDTATGYADLIISTGGASVGQADHTRLLADRMGRVLIDKVAIKPGRPLIFAQIRDRFLFALPGNPVAVMVTYYQFVMPTLYRLMGISPLPEFAVVNARSLQRIRKKPGRTEFQRGVLEKDPAGELTVRTTGKQGSGILSSMSRANAFIILQHDQGPVEENQQVLVQPFSTLSAS